MKGSHYYRGHSETGYETESKLHSPESPFCPFQHCRPGLMTPFDVDLTVLTPLQKADKSNTNRRLFTPQKQAEEIVDGCEIDARHTEHPDPGNPTPKKEELLKENLALKQELEMMKKKYEEKDRQQQVQAVSALSNVVLVQCNVENCGKKFRSIFGLSKHHKHEHGDENVDSSTKHECVVCGRSVKYID